MNVSGDFEDLPTPNKLRLILNESVNIKSTAIYISNSMAIRSRILNSV